MRNSWRWIRHRWRAWHSRRRRDHAVVALAALLSLGVFEPLLCIFHCQFWMPFVLHSYFSTQHHHHMMAAGADMNDADMAGMVHTPVALIRGAALPDGCPLYRGHSSDAPIPPLPSPVHEVTLTLLLLIFVVLLMALQPPAPLTGPPHVFIPVPLRPPILIAG
jgi:hypothetical protein